HCGLGRLQRGRGGERSLAPAALVDERGEVCAEGLVEQQALQELDRAAGTDDAPAVEDFHGTPGGYRSCRCFAASARACRATLACSLSRRRDDMWGYACPRPGCATAPCAVGGTRTSSPELRVLVHVEPHQRRERQAIVGARRDEGD